MVGDVNEIVVAEKDYDCTIFGAAANILGNPQETLSKLLKTVRPKGYILIDEAYLPDHMTNSDVKYKNYDFDSDKEAIRARANELIALHPDKRSIFEGYVKSQLNEYEDLESSIVAATWMLQRK